MQAIDCGDGSGNQESGPKQSIAENGAIWHNHCPWQFDDWVGQPLLVRPLIADHHVET